MKNANGCIDDLIRPRSDSTAINVNVFLAQLRAAAAGTSYSSIHRIWRAHGLKPQLVEILKVSRDKNFAAKVTD